LARRHRLALLLAHLLVADRALVLLVDEVEVERVLVDAAEHPHGNIDEAERDRAAPERAWHPSVVAPRRLSETRARARPSGAARGPLRPQDDLDRPSSFA